MDCPEGQINLSHLPVKLYNVSLDANQKTLPVYVGDVLELTLQPQEGYLVYGLLVNGEAVRLSKDNTYTMPAIATKVKQKL